MKTLYRFSSSKSKQNFPFKISKCTSNAKVFNKLHLKKKLKTEILIKRIEKKKKKKKKKKKRIAELTDTSKTKKNESKNHHKMLQKNIKLVYEMKTKS